MPSAWDVQQQREWLQAHACWCDEQEGKVGLLRKTRTEEGRRRLDKKRRGEIFKGELTQIFLKFVEEADGFFRGSLEDIFLGWSKEEKQRKVALWIIRKDHLKLGTFSPLNVLLYSLVLYGYCFAVCCGHRGPQVCLS